MLSLSKHEGRVLSVSIQTLTGIIRGSTLLPLRLGPAMVEVLIDSFPSAQVRDAVLIAQTTQHDPELFLG
jgi:hypothetical protein